MLGQYTSVVHCIRDLGDDAAMHLLRLLCECVRESGLYPRRREMFREHGTEMYLFRMGIAIRLPIYCTLVQRWSMSAAPSLCDPHGADGISKHSNERYV